MKMIRFACASIVLLSVGLTAAQAFTTPSCAYQPGSATAHPSNTDFFNAFNAAAKQCTGPSQAVYLALAQKTNTTKKDVCGGECHEKYTSLFHTWCGYTLSVNATSDCLDISETMNTLGSECNNNIDYAWIVNTMPNLTTPQACATVAKQLNQVYSPVSNQ